MVRCRVQISFKLLIKIELIPHHLFFTATLKDSSSPCEIHSLRKSLSVLLLPLSSNFGERFLHSLRNLISPKYLPVQRSANSGIFEGRKLHNQPTIHGGILSRPGLSVDSIRRRRASPQIFVSDVADMTLILCHRIRRY